MAIIDDKINAFLQGKPWLKVLLALLTAVLGAGKARGYFARRYGIR